ncbi:hypothetical protein [Halegenticoccus tardaugens]|uniref:hypothetical protein n=1 Tax=Halegenticoccus tardaugens TaxID=2071624 RepID=UPI00100A2686|nr:hypothetical protein [Halegenticoccus tardaugens]
MTDTEREESHDFTRVEDVNSRPVFSTTAGFCHQERISTEPNIRLYGITQTVRSVLLANDSLSIHETVPKAVHLQREALLGTERVDDLDTENEILRDELEAYREQNEKGQADIRRWIAGLEDLLGETARVETEADASRSASLSLPVEQIGALHDTMADEELTANQEHAWFVARDGFDVPRHLSMEEVGDHFRISGQTASERVRRGIKTLVMNTLGEAESCSTRDIATDHKHTYAFSGGHVYEDGQLALRLHVR